MSHVYVLLTEFDGGRKDICAIYSTREKANSSLISSLQRLAEDDETSIVGFSVVEQMVYN